MRTLGSHRRRGTATPRCHRGAQHQLPRRAGVAGGERAGPAGPAGGRGLSPRPAAPRPRWKRDKGRPGCRSSTLGLRRLSDPAVVPPRRGDGGAQTQHKNNFPPPRSRRCPAKPRAGAGQRRRGPSAALPPWLPRRAARGKVRAGSGSPDPWPVRPGPPPAQPGPPAPPPDPRALLTLVAMALPARAALPLCPPSLSPSLSPCRGCSVARVGVSGPPAAAAGPRRRLLLSVPGRRRLLGAAVRLSSQEPALGRRGLMWPRCSRLGRPFRPAGSAPGAAAGLSARSLSVRAGAGRHPLRCSEPRASRPGRSREDGGGRTDLAHSLCPQGLSSAVRVWPQILAGVG